MTVVQLSEISLIYDTVMVLDGINLEVAEGEYVVVLGASGCGKTSLLRIIAGLVTPSAGVVSLGGKDVRRVSPRHRNIALVPQQAGLYPHFPIGKSIAMGINGRLSREDRARRVQEAARSVELETYLDRYPQDLSGGQLRRAAVAKAIASRAFIRLLDEPLSAIDANLRYQIEKDLVQMHRSVPGATVHVTHDSAEAMRLADRVAVIEAGKIVQFDTPSTVQSRPSTPGVAALLGRSPLVTVSMRRGEAFWTSADGQPVAGPEGPVGATATLGYYQDDAEEYLVASKPDETCSGGSWAPKDWIDLRTCKVVKQEHLIWFVDDAIG